MAADGVPFSQTTVHQCCTASKTPNSCSSKLPCVCSGVWKLFVSFDFAHWKLLYIIVSQGKTTIWHAHSRDSCGQGDHTPFYKLRMPGKAQLWRNIIFLENISFVRNHLWSECCFILDHTPCLCYIIRLNLNWMSSSLSGGVTNSVTPAWCLTSNWWRKILWADILQFDWSPHYRNRQTTAKKSKNKVISLLFSCPYTSCENAWTQIPIYSNDSTGSHIAHSLISWDDYQTLE